jgi:hypothetical protein
MPANAHIDLDVLATVSLAPPRQKTTSQPAGPRRQTFLLESIVHVHVHHQYQPQHHYYSRIMGPNQSASTTHTSENFPVFFLLPFPS